MLGREFVEARVNTEPLLRSEAGQRLIASAFQRVTHGVLPRHRLRRSLYCIGGGDDGRSVQVPFNCSVTTAALGTP